MNPQLRRIGALAGAGVWINASEFFRNQVLLAGTWAQHFQSLGMTFPAAPVNALVWVVWGFTFAAVLYSVSRRFSLVETAVLGWVVAFPMMWLVIWNLNVLPLAILGFAVPLSLLECFVGAYICHRVAPR